MISGSHPRSQELEESPGVKTERSAPSANSQKILWDGLTDFERIKRKENQVIYGKFNLSRYTYISQDKIYVTSIQYLILILPNSHEHELLHEHKQAFQVLL